MDTLKTMGKRMKPIFVFVLLEVLLARRIDRLSDAGPGFGWRSAADS